MSIATKTQPNPALSAPAAAAEHSSSCGDLTRLLTSWREGDEQALALLMERLYGELRRIASGYLWRERRGHTLQPTELVNEAFMRLQSQHRVHWRDRTHFFGVAATVMRRLLVDHARRRACVRHGGQLQRVTLSCVGELAQSHDPDLLALDSGLRLLSKVDAEQARLVELRYFAGLSLEETGEVLGINARTVQRRWHTARLWLLRYLEEGSST